nr:DUF3948 family protein [Bacillus cereus]
MNNITFNKSDFIGLASGAARLIDKQLFSLFHILFDLFS